MCRLAHPERDPQALAVRRRRRDRRAPWRRLRPRHDARQSADPRDQPANGPAVVEELLEAGIVTSGSGADNIRNVTGIANRRHRSARVDRHPALRPGLAPPHPQHARRFTACRASSMSPSTAAARVATLEDTNDIGFQAVAREGRRAGSTPGVWFRLTLGGITGHKDFARDTGVILQPERCDGGRRRDRARLHRSRRPHRPQKARLEICARRLGLRQVPRRGREAARRVSLRRLDPADVHRVRPADRHGPISASTGRSNRD